MQDKDHLFQLIHSLTKAEKRFFKLQTSKYDSEKDNNYIKLYEIIEKQDTYDEEKIKQALKSPSIVSQFASIKNYLYTHLLKSLAAFHSKRNSKMRVSSLLEHVDLLFSKGLYKQAKKELGKAKKIAEEYQQTSLLLLINDWEQTFADFEDKFWKTQKNYKILKKEKREIVDSILLKMNIEDLHQTAIELVYTSDNTQTEEIQIQTKSYLENPILNQAKNSPSIYIQNIAYSLESFVLFTIGDRNSGLSSVQKRLVLLESAPHLILDNCLDYCVTIFNYIHTLLVLKQIDTAKKEIAKVERFLENPDLILDARSEEFFQLIKHHHIPFLYITAKEFEKIPPLSKEIEKVYKFYAETKTRNWIWFTVPINVANSYFILGHYDKALHWIRLILNDTTNTILPVILGFTRIYHLLIHYELGNYNILEYYLESTQRYLARPEVPSEIENILLKFVRKLISSIGLKQKNMTLFKKTKEELSALASSSSQESIFITRYYLLSWFDSKIQKRPMLDIILEQ